MSHKFKFSTSMSKVAAFVATFGLLVASVVLPATPALAATSVGPSTSRVLVQPSSTSTMSAQLTGASAMTISGFGSTPATDLVRVEITEAGGGDIKFTTTTGLSQVTGGNPINTTAYGALAFTANVNDANAALTGLQYVAGSAFETASVNIVVSYAGTAGDLYAFNGTNEHFYKFVPTLKTWSEAKTAAAATSFNGMTGYLATSTTADENTFITGRVGDAAAWLSGTRGPGSETNYTWYWATGPANEINKPFFNQSTQSSGPNGTNNTSAGFNFSKWNDGEPNGSGGTGGTLENSLQLLTNADNSKWNDLVDGASQKIGYVIEFGGLAGDTIAKPSKARTITVDVNYPETSSTGGNCVQNISNTTGVTVLDPFGDGSKCIVKFSNTGSTSWRAPEGVTAVETLVVAGGGGGGVHVGAGGGAGGFILKTGADTVSVTAGTGYAVTVGAGGAGATKVTAGTALVSAANGANSVFSSLTAIGGGRGASWDGNSANIGGSGGGGSGFSGGNASLGAAGTATQGNAGGTGHSSNEISQANHHPAAGGGGAGQVGASVSGGQAGKGGDGLSTDISGTTTFYAGGGGGGAHGSADPWTQGTVGAGGNGGGGSGAGPNRTNYGVAMTTAVTGQSAVANTGGGGGGAGSPLTGVYSSYGGAGGSGIVILSYSGTGLPTITSQPSDTKKVPNETALFSVVATSPDSGTLTYQWQEFTTAITATWTDISSATSATYSRSTGANTLANGFKYRVLVTNTAGGSSKTLASNAATLTVSNVAVVNVNFNELNFDYTATKYVNLKKLNVDGGNATQAGTTVTVTDSTGKNIGDRVLFKNVITIAGVTVDAIVTTRKLVSATVKNYESSTNAGGASTNFQTDVDILAANGYAEFKFDFYLANDNIVANCNAAITCAGTTKTILENINVSLIDVDYYQWNEVSGLDSYTVSNPTKLKECLVGSLTSTQTCTARVDPTTISYPANLRFQGPSSIDSTIPQDMAVINYGSVETFSLKFGRDRAGTPNYYGVAFKALAWGAAVPQTNGPATTYTISYSGNGNTGGTATSTHVGAVGSSFTVASNSGTLVKTGFTFSGWNTAANGTGTTYAPGATILMPKDGTTLYARWVANALTLSYDANGGTGSPVSESRLAGATANVSTTVPTRNGFSFGGWRKLAECTCAVVASGASFTMPSSNTVLYAYWIAATGTIAYNGNSSTGGVIPTGSSGTSGTSYTVLENTGTLVRTDYTFAGWNTLANGAGTDYVAGSTINYPATGLTLTLYAKWTATPYTLAYNSNGGSAAPASVSKLAGAVFALPASNLSPTRAGYAFGGWNTLANGSGDTTLAGINFTMPGSNTTLYAKWTALPYNITYLVNAPATTTGTGSRAATTGNFGQSVTIGDKGTFEVTNYRFVGWNTLATGLGTDYVVAQTLSMPVNGITLYAKWVLTTIKLTYNANGGSGAPAQETRVANTVITLPNDLPTKTGFNFAGWCADLSSCTTPLARGGGYTVPSSDTVLYAKWTAIDYTLSYDANGGSDAPIAANSNVGLDVVVSATVPTRTGYTFLGWNTLIGATGTDYAAGANFRMGAANSVLYAKWQGDPFTLNYNSNGGSTLSPSSEARSAGSVENISASTPIKTGFTFAGWNTAVNGGGTNVSAGAAFTMPGSNVTLYAKWTALASGVTYNANGGSGVPAAANYTFGDTVTVSTSEPTRNGFTFLGWNTLANGNSTSYLGAQTFSMTGAAVVLYAQWAASTYAVDYDANSGSGAPGASNHAFGATATVSATLPTRAGYDFQGWNTAAVGDGTARATGATFSMPAANVTLYAQWSLATYTVYYNVNGGTGSITPQPGRFGATMTLSNVLPTRAGYSFEGWNTGADAAGVNYNRGGTLIIPTSNVTLYAKWAALSYTLTYSANGGIDAPVASTGLTTGQTFALSTSAPTRTDYWFNGWSTSLDTNGSTFSSGASFTMGVGNVTLHAIWVANIYSVTYNANGGTDAPASAQTVAGNVTVSSSQPTRAGYTFLGWNTNAASSVYTVVPSTSYTPNGNTVLYAIWTANPITLTYSLNGGTGLAPESQTAPFEGDPIQLAGSGGFTKLNSIFQSWNTLANGLGTTYSAEDPTFRLPSTNLTLYAIWSAPYFAVEFDSNGGSTAPVDQFAAPAETVVLTSAKPSKTDVVFSNWTDVSTGATYNAGDTITMPSSNVSLVANYIQRASVPGGGNFTIDEPTTDPTTGGGKSTASGTKVTTITPNVSNAASQCLEDPIDGKCKAVVVIKGKGTWTLTNGVAKFVPVKGFVGKSIVVHRVTSKSGLIAKANLEAVYTKRPPVTINIGNFIDGSPRITALIGSKIRAFIKRYADYRTIECVGFTEGPTVLKTDKWLSNQRAINACGFVKTNLKKKFVQLPIKAAQGTVEARENRRITITLRD